MQFRNAFPCMILVAATAATAQVSVIRGPDRDPATPTLDTIKKLAGDWVELNEDGTPGDTVASSYRVSAGGSAVLDIEFAGTDHLVSKWYLHDQGENVYTAELNLVRRK